MSIITYQTIFQTVTLGAVSSYPTYASPLTITAYGAVEVNSTTAGVAGILGPVGSAWTVTNLGTVESVGNQGLGIDLESGGLVINGSTSVATATISGTSEGVLIKNGAGTLSNFGTIHGAGYNAVDLHAGGSLGNALGGAITGGLNGVFVSGAAGTLSNYGTIVGGAGSGIFVYDGGSVSNASTGYISGADDGVLVHDQSATVVNAGTLTGFYGIHLSAGGYVKNTAGGFISGPQDAVFMVSGGGTVVNGGTLEGFYGIGLGAGGFISNASTGLISVSGNAVNVHGTVAATVVNAGTIDASGFNGVYLGGGGIITNSAGAVISGGGAGVFTRNQIATVINAGTIDTGTAGRTVRMDGGGLISNTGLIVDPGTAHAAVSVHSFPATVVNGGTIDAGYLAVYFQSGGGVTNSAGGVISGGTNGIQAINTAATVSNGGTIIGGAGAAVDLASGGNVTNTTSGLITGVGGITISGTSGTVANSGTIAASGTSSTGVYMAAGGSVTNAGTGFISAGADAVVIAGTRGAVVNSATIAGSNLGVWLKAGGTVTNSGTVAGTGTSGDGVTFGYLGAGVGTLVNTGAITANNLGVWLSGGGTVTNGPSGATTASIAGVSDGIEISGTTGTVVNLGTVTATGTFGASVYLADGGRLTNGASGLTSALIVGDNNGVAIFFAPGSVTNFATIESIGTAGYGVVISNGGTVTNSGTIRELGTSGAGIRLGAGGSVMNGHSGSSAGVILAGGDAVDVLGSAGTAVNFGTVKSTNGDGVYLARGGTVTNSGIIAGATGGVAIANTSGAVINLVTIKATSPSAPQVTGVALFGGSITNGAATATHALIQGAQYGAEIGNAAGTVVNFGSIVATATGGIGLRLVHGGSIDNLGRITGPSTGIFLDRATSVTNGKSGTAKGYISGQTGVNLQKAGTLTNYGRIAGTGTGSTTGLYFVRGGAIHNFGTITAGGTAGGGVDFAFLNAGAIVINGKSGGGAGLIGGVGAGVSIEASGGTVTNFATISGGTDGIDMSGTVAVVLNNFGTINGGSHGAYLGGTARANVFNSGTINGGGEGIHTRDAAARVTNSGTGVIEGDTGNAIDMTDGGTVTNQGRILSPNAIQAAINIFNAPGSVNNSGSISGGTGILLGGGIGTVTNSGKITATGTTGDGVDLAAGGRVSNTTTAAAISGGDTGVLVSSTTGTVVSIGTITGGLTGVILDQGGSVTNGKAGAADGLIEGYCAVCIYNAVGTIGNFGTLFGTTGFGAYLQLGGTVRNGQSGGSGGLIAGSQAGVYVHTGLGTVVNFGSIDSTGTGGIGIAFKAGGTVTDAGTIRGASGTAIGFGGTSANRLVLRPGYHFGGKVVGSASAGATNTLELGSTASVGTLSAALATKFVNFGTVTVDAGARWTLTGPIALAGITLTDLGTLTIAGSIGGGSLIVDPASLINSGSIGTTVTLAGGSYLGNKAGGKIAAAGDAVYGIGGAATVVNQGKITGTSGAGVRLQAGGRVTNKSSASITGGDGGVYILGGAGTLSNSGTIASNGTFADGVYLNGGGAVTNSGVVRGLDGVDLRIAGTVTNSGTIIGGGSGNVGGVFLGFNYSAGAFQVKNTGNISSSATGVLMRGAGNIDNGNSAATGATISGSIGVQIFGGGTVVNYGTIIGTGGTTGYGGIGIELLAGGTVRDAGTITGTGGTAISFGGTSAIRLILDPGYHLNGMVLGSTGTGATNTLELGSTASVGTLSAVIATEFVQFGTIRVDKGARWVLASNNTIGAGQTLSVAGTLTDLGTLTNAGMITGGGRLIVDPATLFNSGSIGMTVTLAGGGYLGNKTAGKITVSGNAVVGIGAAATVVNQGKITGASGAGVRLLAGGRVANGSSAATGATITGSTGVQIAGIGVATVVNFGTVTGTAGIAIGLGTGNDRVVIEKGSALNGAVAGFHPGDTFDLPFMSFSSTGTATLKAGNVLRVVENGGTFNIKLDPGQNFAGDFFHLSSDGGTGTLVTENNTPPSPYSISPNPAKVLDNAGKLTFTITRTNASGPAVVYASVVQDQGSANNGDYTFVNDTEVYFAAGVASVKVSVGIIDTGAASGSEAFRFIIQQHKTDPVSTFLASDKFTITNTTAPAAATPRFTFAEIAPAGALSGVASSGSPSNYLPEAIAASERPDAGGPQLLATGHPGGSLLSLAGGANHDSLLPALR